MKTPIYNLIVQSEEKNRTVLETLSFAVLILSAVASIWHAAVQPIVMPADIAANQATPNTEYRA